MSHGLALSLHCVSYAASVFSSRRPSSSRLSLLWFSAGWTTATVRWLVYQPISYVDFSQSRTQRHGSYSGSVVAITSLTVSSVFTGYECRNERIVLEVAVRYRLIGRCMVTLHNTCNDSHAPPTSLLGTDSGTQSPTVCSFLLQFLLSVAALFLSLVLVYGTIVAVHI